MPTPASRWMPISSAASACLPECMARLRRPSFLLFILALAAWSLIMVVIADGTGGQEEREAESGNLAA